MQHIKKERNAFWTMLFRYLLYKLVLDLIYLNWVYPIYEYSGYYLESKISTILISYFILLLFVICLPKNDKKVSYMILQIHLVVLYIPMLTIYGLGNGSFDFVILVSACFIFQSSFIRIMPTIKFPKIKYNSKLELILVYFLIIMTVLIYAYLLKTQNLNWSAFNFESIYSIRENIVLGEGIIVYLVTWQYRIINPFIIVSAYVKNNKMLMFFAIMLQILTFLILPHKEILFSLGLIFIVLMFEKLHISFTKNFVNLINFMSVVSIFIYIYLKERMPFALLTRLLFEPAKIKFQYYEFFLNREKLLYSEGLIGRILGLKYPYSQPIGFIVYNFFEPFGKSNSNAGYIAYAYANADILGMIVMSILFVIVLMYFDSLARAQNKMVILSLVIYPMILLNDGDLLTMLLTGGLLLLMTILLFQSKENYKKNTSESEDYP